MSFKDFQKKKGTPVNPGAVVERPAAPAAAPMSASDADAELASWWKSNQTPGPAANTAAQQRRFRGESSSDSDSDGEAAKKAKAKPKVKQPDPVHVKMAPPPAAAAGNFAQGKYAAPVATSTPGAMSMEEIEALARKETEEMAARMKAAGMSPRGPTIMDGSGAALDLDHVTSGRARPTGVPRGGGGGGGGGRVPLDLDNLPQQPNDGLFGPDDEKLNPPDKAPPAAVDFGSRLGAAIDDATVNANPTVKDAERKWYLIKSKKGAIVRAGVELDTDHVCNLEANSEILVDGTGQTKEGKERLRMIDPCKGWTTAGLCKPRPGFKNTQTFQEFMDAQSKRAPPKLF